MFNSRSIYEIIQEEKSNILPPTPKVIPYFGKKAVS